MKFKDDDFVDFSTLMAMYVQRWNSCERVLVMTLCLCRVCRVCVLCTQRRYSDYITTEPFVPNVGDVRIQRVGDQVRAYRRVTAGWKGNVGEAEVEDIPVTPLYQLWAGTSK
jgi:hypothetical protein